MKIKIFLFLFLMFAKDCFSQKINYKFPNDYRGTIHLHSKLSSDSNGKFENIVKAAKNNQTDFVIMTDHWSSELFEKSKRGFFENTLFISGAEISKNEGVTLVAIPLPKYFVPENDWRKNITSLHQDGALAFASHIEFSETAQLVNADGIEMTNLHSILVDRSYAGFFWAWLQALWPKNWDLSFLFNDIHNLKRWHYLNQEKSLPAFAGNDTHDNYRLFWKIGPKLGSYDNTFKLITTHIWAEELSEKSVIEAIKKGQSYFSFEIFGNSKGFRFYATLRQVQGKQNNTEIFLPGETAYIPNQTKDKQIPITLTIQAPPHKDPKNTILKILCDGRVIKKGSGIILNFETTSPGNYYAEIWKNGKPWICSNPIKIQ